jgi:GTP-binding protein
MKAEFVRSAARAADFPGDGLSQVALVGRSNVGKSSLINALVRQRVARAGAAPGTTRLANIYRVEPRSGQGLYLVDLPGYGYARGGEDTARQFDELTRTYFGLGQMRRESRAAPPGFPAQPAPRAALLLIDARHPGLSRDVAAWAWLRATAANAAVVATKIDKLARGERIRAMRSLQSVFDVPVAPVSAVTGEGLDYLWKLIDKLAHSRPPNPRSHPPRPRATAPPPPTPRRASKPAPSKVEGPKK